jgi:glutathione S-transferase
LASDNAEEPHDMITLYVAPGSCSLASHIALRDAGADFTVARVDFKATQQQSADYLKINPKGRVPALVTPHGMLTETPAILAYIAQSHPQARLAPSNDPFAFAELQAFNSYLCSTVHVAHAHRMRGYRWTDDADAIVALQKKVPANMAACFSLIERDMLRGPWVMGEAYTIADPYLFTLAGWLDGDGVDVARFPKVAGHHRRMSERLAVKAAIAAELA